MAKSASAENNVYTVLIFAALVALIAGIIYVLIRLKELGINALSYPESSQAMLDTASAIGVA